MRKGKFFWFLLFILLLNLGFRVYSYHAEYSSRYDPVYWKGRYLRSQWVVSDSPEPIGDDGLYAYAGWEYVHGRDPATLNAEMPPLGKYLIGLSILAFGNQNIFALLGGLLVLVVFYQLNQLVFKDSFLALLPVAAFSLEPLFWQQLRAPFLDLLYLLFLLLVFYFFLCRRLFLAAVFLGLMAATKASASTFILVGLTIALYLFSRKEWSLLKQCFLLLPISSVSFTLTYFRYFWLGHSLKEFLGVQKWILNFYQIGAKGVFAGVWSMLLMGKWLTWWGESARIAEWWIGWPILTVFSMQYLVFRVVRKKFDQSWIFGLWVLIYLLFLSFIPVWPRYLLLILPFLYNLVVWPLNWLRNIEKR